MKYAFFIASFINDQRSENILIECIKSIKDNCTISNDIYIINDNWDKKENILKLSVYPITVPMLSRYTKYRYNYSFFSHMSNRPIT